MGCVYSSSLLNPNDKKISSSSATPTFTGIRVMHVNGNMVEFQPPITAGNITGDPPKYVLFTPAKLVCPGTQPLKPGDQLEPGRVYFLLPLTIFNYEIDYTALATRLSALARSARVIEAAACESNQSTEPDRTELHRSTTPNCAGSDRVGQCGVGVSAQRWRPELDTIAERSLKDSSYNGSSSSSYSYNYSLREV